MDDEFEERDVITEEILEPEVTDQEIIDSVKLNPKESPEDQAPEDLKEVMLSDVDEETKELYLEFNRFLKTSAELEHGEGVKAVVSSGFNLLDAILGGGFALGALNIIVGMPGSGKSTLAGQVLGNAQKLINDPILAAYLDSEEAITTARLANLGVRKPRIKPYNDITIEKVFKYIEGLCVFKEQKGIVDIPSIVIWDSIANTLSVKERETDDPNSVIGFRARLLSLLVPKYVSKLNRYNICLIAVNQLRDIISMGNFPAPKELRFMTGSKDMPGGNVVRFNAFQLLEMRIKESVKPEKYGFEGIVSTVKCVKNKLFPLNIPIELVGSFNTGFSNFWTNYRFLAAQKRIITGAWNYLRTYPEKKFYTKDAAAIYKTNEDFRKAFNEAIEEAIKTEIVDKFTTFEIEEE